MVFVSNMRRSPISQHKRKKAGFDIRPSEKIIVNSKFDKINAYCSSINS